MTEPVASAEPFALAEPTRRVGRGFLTIVALANLGTMVAFFTPIQNLLPRLSEQVGGADGKETALAWITGVGALVAVVANPLAGALSDRTTSQFGRRRPWVLGGALVGGLAIVTLPTQGTVLGLALLWGCGQAAVNASYAGITATIPDQVPVSQRGVASGWVGVSQTLGVVLGVALVSFAVTSLAPGAWATALLAMLLVVPFLFYLRDPVLPVERRPAFHLGAFVRGFWVSPRQYPDFAWAWITRFLISLSNAMATLYLLFFLKDQVGYDNPEQGQTILIAIYALGTMVTAVIGGRLSDRSGRRKIYVIVSSIVMAVAGLLLAGFPTFSVAMLAAAVLGAGYGVYLAVDQALITQVLPAAADRGRDLGVINIANSAPQVLGPVIAAPIVTTLGGYPVLYGATAFFALLSAVMVTRIVSVP
ncbi:MAG TPA: MFS transporter [Candidatus Limnocylindria bacterium]|nr:MFS transporter [Candidatus Limnocylindria bacterium]